MTVSPTARKEQWHEIAERRRCFFNPEAPGRQVRYPLFSTRLEQRFSIASHWPTRWQVTRTKEMNKEMACVGRLARGGAPSLRLRSVHRSNHPPIRDASRCGRPLTDVPCLRLRNHLRTTLLDARSKTPIRVAAAAR